MGYVSDSKGEVGYLRGTYCRGMKWNGRKPNILCNAFTLYISKNNRPLPPEVISGNAGRESRLETRKSFHRKYLCLSVLLGRLIQWNTLYISQCLQFTCLFCPPPKHWHWKSHYEQYTTVPLQYLWFSFIIFVHVKKKCQWCDWNEFSWTETRFLTL